MTRKSLLTRRLFSAVSIGKVISLGVLYRVMVLSGDGSEASAAETEQDFETAKQPSRSTTRSRNRSDEIDFLRISEAEWKRRLTPAQFQVARMHGTERPFSGKFHNDKKDGAYGCVCCKTLVFDSKHKFDSGTGWPSFWQPWDDKVTGESPDDKLGYPRTEVHCSRCNAHLGHVFKDAPKTPTGLRYCINSVCLVFVPRKEVDEIASDR